jgi:hypothetical protein
LSATTNRKNDLGQIGREGNDAINARRHHYASPGIVGQCSR